MGMNLREFENLQLSLTNSSTPPLIYTFTQEVTKRQMSWQTQSEICPCRHEPTSKIFKQLQPTAFNHTF